jgi:molybdenum cofactor cytidylyltransferase
MPETCAIILAAGESVRMKTNKMLLPYNGSLIISTVIDKVIRSGVDHILVVLGAFRDEISAVVESMPVTVCYNANYKQGMLTSVQCGFRNMPETAEAGIIFLGDQPMIPDSVSRKIIRSFAETEKGILVPAFQGKRGHPVLISRKYAVAIEKLDPEQGLRALLMKFDEDVLVIEVDLPAILRDIDTVEDYRNEITLN